MKGRVLVVDDSPRMLEMICLFLQMDYEVVTARDGAEGIKKTHEAQPQLIIMDQEMPEMDGLEATRRLRDDPATGQIPIIMLTGSDDVADEMAVEGRHGASGCLMKPFSRTQLLDSVRTLLS